MNTKFKVIGLTRLEVNDSSIVYSPEADVLTVWPAEL